MQNPSGMEAADPKSMTILEHLEELRSRLMMALLAVAVGVVVGIIFSKPIYQLLAAPMKKVLSLQSSFIATDPIEAFMTYMKTGFVAGIFVAVPFLFYELWQFIVPALYAHERRRTVFFVVMTSFFFVGGALFGYFIVFPTSFSFFAGLLSGTGIIFLPKMNEYFGFAVRLLFAFGIVFELPVLILLLARIGVLTAQMLKRARPFCIVGIFIIAGLMTGPDVASQLLMAGPLLILFELGVIMARLFGKKSD